MSEKAKNALAIYKSLEGKEEGVGDWLEIDQDRINMFADATLDHQFIHVDCSFGRVGQAPKTRGS